MFSLPKKAGGGDQGVRRLAVTSISIFISGV
jgi:hypothetical protein